MRKVNYKTYKTCKRRTGWILEGAKRKHPSHTWGLDEGIKCIVCECLFAYNLNKTCDQIMMEKAMR